MIYSFTFVFCSGKVVLNVVGGKSDSYARLPNNPLFFYLFSLSTLWGVLDQRKWALTDCITVFTVCHCWADTVGQLKDISGYSLWSADIFVGSG